MWRCVWCMSFRSSTILLHYIMVILGGLMEIIVQFPDVASSVGLAQYIPPPWLPHYTWAIAVLTLLARSRSLIFRREEEHKENPDAGPTRLPF